MSEFYSSYGYANHSQLVRFAPDVDRAPGKVQEVHLSQEEIDAAFKRAANRYRFDPPMKRPIVPMPSREPRRNLPVERSKDELEVARRTYIEKRSIGEYRTHIVPFMIEHFHMSHHEFYKCIRRWGYDDRTHENQDIEKFLNGLF